jgi:hypothetical protein
MEAQIQLLSHEDEANLIGLHAAIMATSIGKLRGLPRPDNPALSKYIGVFFNPKVSRETNHRPQLRIPPLPVEPFTRLIQPAKNRFMEEGEEIPEGDLRVMCDGGRFSSSQELLKCFGTKCKRVKTFTAWWDKHSLDTAAAEAQGRHRHLRADRRNTYRLSTKSSRP